MRPIFDRDALLVQSVIKNLDAYVNGEIPFSEVGVKAVDKYTLGVSVESTDAFPT